MPRRPLPCLVLSQVVKALVKCSRAPPARTLAKVPLSIKIPQELHPGERGGRHTCRMGSSSSQLGDAPRRNVSFASQLHLGAMDAEDRKECLGLTLPSLCVALEGIFFPGVLYRRVVFRSEMHGFCRSCHFSACRIGAGHPAGAMVV